MQRDLQNLRVVSRSRSWKKPFPVHSERVRIIAPLARTRPIAGIVHQGFDLLVEIVGEAFDKFTNSIFSTAHGKSPTVFHRWQSEKVNTRGANKESTQLVAVAYVVRPDTAFATRELRRQWQA